MRILVTGGAGMLGHALVPVLEERHLVVKLTRSACDLRDEEAVRKIIQLHRPGMIMHLAAFTSVDACEREPQRATEQNEIATRNVAKAAREIGAAVLYTSTDYVFGGEQVRPYREDDPPHPLNIYGRSKLRGEKQLQEILDRYLIVRTSWLFGPHGRNFVAAILKLAEEKKELRVVNDQCGSPTYTRHLARKLEELATSRQHGVFHVTGTGSCTWFEFAEKIAEFSGMNGVSLAPVSSSEFGSDARRPPYSVLANERLREHGLGLLPHWTVGLKDYLREIKEERNGNIGRRPACASCA